MDKINKKRILLALSPLIVFNLVLVFDLVFLKNTVWSQIHDPYEWGNDERLYTNKTSQRVEEDGQHLFTYEGEDANCWSMEKEWQVKECLRDHPYGGQGTMIMGGNLVMNNTQAIYMNGFDSSGSNWMMSTTTEPYGNTMSASWGTSTDMLYGNHLLANGTMKTGALNFEAASSSVVFDERECFMVSDTDEKQVKKLVFSDEIEKEDSNVLEVLNEGICGMCDGSCSGGLAGSGYQFISEHGLDIKETTKANQAIRLCGYTEACEDACCRLAQYLTDDTWSDFVGFDCESTACDGGPKPSPYGEGEDFCYPQEYPHYARQEKLDKSVDYTESGGYYFRREDGYAGGSSEGEAAVEAAVEEAVQEAIASGASPEELADNIEEIVATAAATHGTSISVEQIQGYVTSAVDGIANGLQALSDITVADVKDYAISAMDGISRGLQSLSEISTQDVRDAIDAGISAVENGIGAVADVASSVATAVSDTLTEIGTAIGNVVDSVKNDLNRAVEPSSTEGEDSSGDTDFGDRESDPGGQGGV